MCFPNTSSYHSLNCLRNSQSCNDRGGYAWQIVCQYYFCTFLTLRFLWRYLSKATKSVTAFTYDMFYFWFTLRQFNKLVIFLMSLIHAQFVNTLSGFSSTLIVTSGVFGMFWEHLVSQENINTKGPFFNGLNSKNPTHCFAVSVATCVGNILYLKLIYTAEFMHWVPHGMRIIKLQSIKRCTEETQIL